MKKGKRVLSVLLVALMVVLAVPVAAHASNQSYAVVSEYSANGNCDDYSIPEGKYTFYYGESPYLSFITGKNVFVFDATLYLYKDGSLYKTIRWSDDKAEQGWTYTYFHFWSHPVRILDVGKFSFYYHITYNTAGASNSTRAEYDSGTAKFEVIDRTPVIQTSASTVNLDLASNPTQTINIWCNESTSYKRYYQLDKGTSSAFSCSGGEWTNGKLPVTITAQSKASGQTLTLRMKKSEDDSIVATKTVTVNITAPSYTISYNANGGSGAPSSQTKTYNESLTLSSTIPTRTGYTFLGWSTSSTATSPSYYPGETYSSNAGKTFYAVWKQTTLSPGSSVTAPINFGNQMYVYKVTPSTSRKYVIYSTSSTDTKVYLYNSSGSELSNNDDGGDNQNFRLAYDLSSGSTYYYGVRYYSSSSTGSIPVTFGPVYSVSYNANGGSGAPSGQTKDYGKSIALSSTQPSRSGYNFLGWSTSSSSNTVAYRSGDTYASNADLTLYAVWSDANNPTASISCTNSAASSQTITLTLSDNAGIAGYYWGTSSSYSNNAYTSTSSTSITKSGFSSSGTYYLTAKDTSGNLSPTVSITLYKTTLNANGGSVSPTSVLTKSGNSFTFPTPTRTGYTYQGWSTSSTATSGVKSLAPSSNTTYYAVWKAITHTLTYNANGGSGAPGSQILEDNNVISSTIPTRLGYTFLGWSTSSSATSASYLPGSTISSSANVTLYAVWKQATISSGSSFTTPITYAGQVYYYKYTPSSTQAYVIYSTGSDDTYVYLYSSSGSELAKDDDGGDSSNFRLSQHLTAGTTYYYAVRYYNSSRIGNIAAKFGPVYTVTYNANGGSSAPAAQMKDWGRDVTLSSAQPRRDGYTFLGWSTGSSSSTVTYRAGDNYSNNANQTLYAVWSDTAEPTATISCTNNLAASQTLTLKFTDNAGIAGYYWGTSSIYSNNAYTSTGSTSVTKTVSSAGTYYLTAKDAAGNLSSTVKIALYEIRLNANGGSVSPSSVLISGSNSFTFPTPSRSGYTYQGWATSGTASSGIKSLTPTENATYYAIWAKAKHTVTYNYAKNGGTSATKTSASVEEGATIDLTPTAAKPDWEFLGWNTDPEAREALPELRMGSSNVTLYAIFKQKQEKKNAQTDISIIYDRWTDSDPTIHLVVERTDTNEISIPIDYVRINAMDISPEDENRNEVELDGPVTVQIPLPEGFNADNIAVFHKHTKTGVVERIEDVRIESVNGKACIVFTTDSFSVFILVDTSPDPNMCHWCGQVHTGFFGGFIAFFHRIFARLFGEKF